jgi:two-component system sensor histidine kinase RegB
MSEDAPYTAPPSSAGSDDAIGRKNMQLLVQLRWIAVAGQIATILVVQYGLGIDLPVHAMVTTVLALAAFNAASFIYWRDNDATESETLFALLVDVAALTAQLYLSGGTGNPFVFLYLLQVILGAVLLRPLSAWTMLAITSLCFAALTQWHRPLHIATNPAEGMSAPYVLGLLLCFVLDAVLLAVFVTRINANLRARAARLAGLRQRAAEEEHIVRMGLLASGAAHELGTPLATLAVILGDWRRMAPFRDDAELRAELDEMQAQVQRCKTIVTGILLSAGSARGEASMPTTLGAFIDDTVAHWRATRAGSALRVTTAIDAGLPIVSDSALKQMIDNVLDNALEASPKDIALDVRSDAETLTLSISDDGPGFPPAMLEEFGKPYQSSKGRPGGGLGLFLVVNVARTLGGGATARNKPEGGATVTLTLPLSAISFANEAEHGH